MSAGPVIVIGSVVQLASGGPPMTVEVACVSASVQADKLQADCVWMAADGTLQRARFDVATLEPVEEPTP